MKTHSHAQSIEQLLERIESLPILGLTKEQVLQRQEQYGDNALPKGKTPSILALLLRQFQNPLIYLLFFSALIAYAIDHPTDAQLILAVLLINALIGTYQEKRAHASMEALRKMNYTVVRVIRSGEEFQIDAKELVPGDIIILVAGDVIGADARIIEANALQVEEAALTGESIPVVKTIQPLPENTLLVDRTNMIYAGTYVVKGRCRAVVVATGLATEMGQIASLAEKAEPPITPLQEKIGQFARQILILSLFIFLLVAVIGWVRGMPFITIFMTALSLVISIVPEGLPAAMTIALAVGMQRMARKGAIVRQPEAVETLAATDIICTDKTGTLTQNKMSVVSTILPLNDLIENENYARQADPQFKELLFAAILCNDATMPACSTETEAVVLGDPTEVALLQYAQKNGFSVEEVRKEWNRVNEIPFESETKWMAVEVENGQGKRTYLKGAPESILFLCNTIFIEGEKRPLEAHVLQLIQESEHQLAEKGLRILAFACAEHSTLNHAVEEKTATFLGLIAQMDPPRDEVLSAINACRKAGIRTVIMTGDHRLTAMAIGKMVGILGENEQAIDGGELERLSDKELLSLLPYVSIFARVQPSQKLRIISLYQALGHTVAMTGDGVNDAPALVKADVGIAMGQNGTEIAKEASKIILTDDRFTTIVDALRTGKTIFRNIRKLVLYLIATGLTTLTFLLSTLVLKLPLPLLPVHILWINLITDGVLALPIILQYAEGDETQTPPLSREEPLITKNMFIRLMLMVGTMLSSLFMYYSMREPIDTPIELYTGTFTLLAVCQWCNALNCRSEASSAFYGLWKDQSMLYALLLSAALQALTFTIPILHSIFHTSLLPITELMWIMLFACPVLLVEETRKWWKRR